MYVHLYVVFSRYLKVENLEKNKPRVYLGRPYKMKWLDLKNWKNHCFLSLLSRYKNEILNKF